MVVSDSDKIYIEVNDRSSLLGKKLLNSKADYYRIHSFIVSKLSLLKDYDSCRALVQFSFNQLLMRETLFLIDLITKREITWENILNLQKVHKFKVDLEFDNSETEDRHKIKVVHIKFQANKKCLGKFVKRKTSDEFQFIKR